MDVPHFGLLGLIAFVLNYIPTAGSIIAGVPAVILALLVNGWTGALLIGGGYLAVNVVIGNILEPRWMGKSSNLSPVAVVFSMLFWGFILGPVGALLSVPLTMMVRILAEDSLRYRWLAVLLESPRNTQRVSREIGVLRDSAVGDAALSHSTPVSDTGQPNVGVAP